MKSVITALAIIMGLAGGASAEGALSPLKQLEMSRAIYNEGLARVDPVLIVAAAKLRRDVSLQQVDRRPEAGDAVSGGPMSALTMFSVAADMARGDAVASALVEAELARLTNLDGSKGLQGGPAFSAAAIAAKKVDKYPGLTFKGGTFAEVYVEGHGAANLDIFVYDNEGRLVCSDTDVSDFAHCGWYPEATATYAVHVVNKGNGTQYSLVTN